MRLSTGAVTVLVALFSGLMLAGAALLFTADRSDGAVLLVVAVLGLTFSLLADFQQEGAMRRGRSNRAG